MYSYVTSTANGHSIMNHLKRCQQDATVFLLLLPVINILQCVPMQCLQLERQLEESQNEVRQLTAKLETLQRTIDWRSREVEHLENENGAIQFQVGWSEIYFR